MKNFSKAGSATHLLHFRDISNTSKRGYGFNLSKPIYLFGVLLFLGILFLLEALTQLERPWSIEMSILQFLHSYAIPAIDQIALMVSASVTVIAVVMLIYLIYRRAWHATAFWLAATLGAEVIVKIAKHLSHHNRPHLWDVISHQSSYAFPSGHATLSMAIAMAWFVISLTQIRVFSQILISAVFVVAVGLCRMYLGLHFPIDVLAGWSLAIAWICMLALTFKKINLKTGLARAA